MTQQRSPFAVEPSEGARRYFSQFLGHATRWTPLELDFLRAIEAQSAEELTETGQRAYQAVRQLQRTAAGRSKSETTLALFSDQPGLALADLTTALYAALVNALAREMEVDTPAQVRGLPMTPEMSGMPSDHLTLVGRFSMDTMLGLRAESSFSAMIVEAADRLGSLVELAAQQMMGAEVDPFETFEHEDCPACGHLLQRHVGFESWDEVRAEHRRWCPGARGR